MSGTDQSGKHGRAGAEALARGASIGRYVVLGLVGRGGMGEVYAAYDPELDRKVAVKLVPAHHRDGGLTGAEKRARLLREAQTIARLSHPNVVVVFDVGTHADSVFIAMEFVEGRTAKGWLEATAQPRSWREVLAVFLAAGRGLAAAHAAGLVHRDFKPENVMVSGDAALVRVMDFGLAAPANAGAGADSGSDGRVSIADDLDPEVTIPVGPHGARPATRAQRGFATRSERRGVLGPSQGPHHQPDKLTQTGALIGTPAYMAPEQFAGQPTDARTDQFSFCVALYESLYGERPFRGTTTPALMTSVLAGVVVDPPPSTSVPSWVRRILLRGLRADPAARHPSMEALLAALSHDPARSRGRLAMALAAAVAVVGVGTAAASLRPERPAAQTCGAGAQRLDGIWEIPAPARGRGAVRPATPRRQAVQRAFLATGKGYAASAYATVARILDQYLGAWADAYEDTCRATHVRGEQSAEVLDLRMSCLGERLDRVRALTDVFTAANATVVENAVSAVSGLPSLNRCADVKLLRTVMRPPDDPAARARVDGLRRELAEAKALGDSGQCAAGAAAASKVVDEAFTVGYLPLQAEALNALGVFGNECTDPGRAVRQFKEAHWAAAAAHHDEAAVEALIGMALIGADRLRDVAAARDAVQLAGAILQRMGPGHAALQASRLAALGIVTSREGQSEEGLSALEQSLALKEKTLGSEHVDVVRTLDQIGVVLAEMGRPAQSVPFLVRARDMAAKLLGPDHPLLALTLANEGAALNALGRYADARPRLERALAIWRAAGSGPFYVAYALASLGESYLGLDMPREARACLEEAVGLYASSPAATSPAARFALARALWSTPGARPRALALARDARTEYEQAAAPAWRVAQVDGWLQNRRRTR